MSMGFVWIQGQVNGSLSLRHHCHALLQPLSKQLAVKNVTNCPKCLKKCYISLQGHHPSGHPTMKLFPMDYWSLPFTAASIARFSLRLFSLKNKTCRSFFNPRYVHLYDCIVFPTKGRRPHPDECSGGDLDGDKFFVSWDRRLIPGWITDPFHYDVAPQIELSTLVGKIVSSVFSPVSKGVSAFGRAHIPSIFGTEQQAEYKRKIKCREELLVYFSNFNNDLVSRVDRVFMKYASR